MTRAVLFDATGTLIELRESVGTIYSRIAREHGVELSAWRLDDAFSRVFGSAPPMVFADTPAGQVAQRERDWWRSVVRSTFLAADSARRFDDFDACFEALWNAFSDGTAWRVREGALELLRNLRRRGIRAAVVSNFDLRLPRILQALGVLEWLDAVVLPGEVGAAKPDPVIFERALARLDCAPDEALFVGNHVRDDLEGARAAGLRAVNVASLATLDALPLPGDETE